MARITPYQGYSTGRGPTTPKPDHPVDPIILTVQEGVPLTYGECHGVGVRVVHPTNPNAPSRNMSLTMFYVPPHAVLGVGSHETEETYVILEGRGRMTFARLERDVSKGDFVYLPSWCEHGIENTGTETLVVLIATSPPNP
jgi:mannose-6-phosphate isomerase-like protein (cupin superfamily)